MIQVVGTGVSLVVDELKSSDGCTYLGVYLNHLVICVLQLSMNVMLGMPLEVGEITQICDNGVACFFSSQVPLKSMTEKGWFYDYNGDFF